MQARRPFGFDQVFVGRASEMGLLSNAAGGVARGQGCVVTVTGDPGMGKSRLLEAFVKETGADARVLQGRCSYAEGAPPYLPWVEIITEYVSATEPELLRTVMGEYAPVIAEVVQSVRSALGELEPPVPLEEPGSARFRFFQAVAASLSNAAKNRPLVVVLHDLHWVDRPSSALLRYLLGEMETTPLLLVLSYRDRQVGENHPLRPALAELARVPRHDQVALNGLTASEVQEFLEVGSHEKVAGGVAELIRSVTGGVPLFVREVAQLLLTVNRLDVPRQERELLEGIPTTIRDLIAGWREQLSPRSSDTIAVASAVGMEFTVDVVAACCAEPPAEVMKHMEEAVALSLLDPGQPGQFHFSHSLVRESILANLSASRLAQIHCQIAEGLERHYGDSAATKAAQLAHHFAASGGLTETASYVRYALLAGEKAISQHAYENAVEFLQGALASAETDARTRAQLLFGLGRARIALNQREEAVDLLTGAFDLFVQAGDDISAVAAAEYPWVVSFRKRGVAQLSQRALALVDPESLQAGKLECQRGMALAQEEREYGEARQACERALEVARAHGDPNLEARSLLLAAFIESEEQNLESCLKRSLEALKISRRISDPPRIIAAHHLAQEALIAAGRFSDGRRHAGKGLAAAELLQDRFWLMLAYAANQRYRIACGDWRGARDFSDRGLVLAPNDPFLLANRARLEYETGNSTVGETYLWRYLKRLKLDVEAPADRADHQNASVASVVPLICRVVDVVEVTQWLDLAETAARALLDSPHVSPQWRFRATSCLALIAAVRTDKTAALKCYSQLTKMVNPDPGRAIVFCRGSMTFVQAQLARVSHTAGDLEPAIEHFEAAESACRAANHWPELAWICHDYAVALTDARRPGDSEHAADLLGEGAELAERHGMVPLGKQIAKLRESSPRRAPCGLTPRQLVVLRLVARGKTNREIAVELFNAERTVSNHVSNILAKIGCSNRTEAAAFAHRHGLDQP